MFRVIKQLIFHSQFSDININILTLLTDERTYSDNTQFYGTVQESGRQCQ